MPVNFPCPAADPFPLRRLCAAAALAFLAHAAAAAEAPAFKADTAVYSLDTGVLQYAFTFVNPSDSAIFLDCQLPPKASLSGNTGTLILEFDRASAPAAAENYPPQRIGPRQTFRGQRRLDRLLGPPSSSLPLFTSLQLRMGYFPESPYGGAGSGEAAFAADRQAMAESRPVTLVLRGKPSAPKAAKHRVRPQGE